MSDDWLQLLTRAAQREPKIIDNLQEVLDLQLGLYDFPHTRQEIEQYKQIQERYALSFGGLLMAITDGQFNQDLVNSFSEWLEQNGDEAVKQLCASTRHKLPSPRFGDQHLGAQRKQLPASPQFQLPPWDVITMLVFWIIGLFFYPTELANTFLTYYMPVDKIGWFTWLVARAAWFGLWFIGYRLSAVLASWIAIGINEHRDPFSTSPLEGNYRKIYKIFTLLMLLS